MSVEVPEGWHSLPLGSIARIFTGKTPSTKDPENWGGKIPFVTPTDLNGSVFIGATERYVTDHGAAKLSMLPANSVLYTCIASIGKSGISTSPCVSNQQINACVFNDSNNPVFHYYQLQKFTPDLGALAGKTAVSIINKSKFSEFEILCPPLPEQQRIAEILSSVDESIRATEAVIAQAERVKRGLMEDLLTGGLGSAAIANGEVPRGWMQVTISDVVQIDWGDTSTTKKSYVDAGFVAYSAAGPDGFLAHFDYNCEGIVLSAIGTCGRVFWAEGKWSAIKNTMVIIDNNPLVRLKYFFYCAQLPDFWPISGGAQPFIGLKNARAKSFVLPDVRTQDESVRAISSVDDQITANRATVEQLQRLKRGLMDDLLTGKVRTVA